MSAFSSQNQDSSKNQDRALRRSRQDERPPKRRGRVWLFRLGALLFGLALAFVFCEVFVLWRYGEQPKFPRRVVEAPWGLRYNDPGARYRHKSADVNVWFQINRQGMRADRDYAYDKPAGARRIVCVGDSFTIGYEVAEEDCFARVLERELRSRGRAVEVLNAGVSGFSNAEECLYVERELIKYSPDVVVLSFYSNDLNDNLRTGLLSLDSEGHAVPWHERYVPAGRLGTFLNSNWFFNLLSERSNAFVLFKEKATMAVKKLMEKQNEEALDEAGGEAAEAGRAPRDDGSSEARRDDARRRLAAAIIDRLYGFLRERDIALVVHVIPSQPGDFDAPLLDEFPLEHFSVERPGLFILHSRELLEPHRGKELLYWQHSHSHWTPFSHRLAGEALARLIEDAALLD